MTIEGDLQAGRLGRLCILRLRPNQDLTEGVEAACRDLGLAWAVIRAGIGSLNDAHFDSGGRQVGVTGPGLEILTLSGEIAPDASGRQSPEVIEGADYVEEADLVIMALGFEPEELPTLWHEPAMEVTRWGTIKAEFGTHKTMMDGVYAVGDIVRGASLVVWAIRDGREAAETILNEFNASAQVAAE